MSIVPAKESAKYTGAPTTTHTAADSLPFTVFRTGQNHLSASSQPERITLPNAYRVRRGGSWVGGPWNLRSANRDRNTTGFRFNFIGFRVARTLTP